MGPMAEMGDGGTECIEYADDNVARGTLSKNFLKVNVWLVAPVATPTTFATQTHQTTTLSNQNTTCGSFAIVPAGGVSFRFATARISVRTPCGSESRGPPTLSTACLWALYQSQSTSARRAFFRVHGVRSRSVEPSLKTASVRALHRPSFNTRAFTLAAPRIVNGAT